MHRLASADALVEELTDKMKNSELELAAARATLAAKQDITAELRSFLDNTRAKSDVATQG